MANKKKKEKKVKKHREPVKKPKEKRKKIKKRWYPILGPKLFNNMQIGESLAEEPQQLKDKIITCNLMSLTRDPRKQNAQMKFRVKEIKDNKAHTEVFEYSILQAHIKRLTRKMKGRVLDSFEVTSSDGVKFRLKPMILIRADASKMTKTAIRKQAQDLFTEQIKKETFKKFTQDMLTEKMQKDIARQLKKIHPVRSCKIRAFKRA